MSRRRRTVVAGNALSAQLHDRDRLRLLPGRARECRGDPQPLELALADLAQQLVRLAAGHLERHLDRGLVLDVLAQRPDPDVPDGGRAALVAVPRIGVVGVERPAGVPGRVLELSRELQAVAVAAVLLAAEHST